MEKRFAETFPGDNFRQKYFWRNDKLELNAIKAIIILINDKKCQKKTKSMVLIQ